jgi:hypothetical protein
MLEKDYQLTGTTVELQQAKKTVGLLRWQLGTLHSVTNHTPRKLHRLLRVCSQARGPLLTPASSSAERGGMAHVLSFSLSGCEELRGRGGELEGDARSGDAGTRRPRLTTLASARTTSV